MKAKHRHSGLLRKRPCRGEPLLSAVLRTPLPGKRKTAAAPLHLSALAETRDHGQGRRGGGTADRTLSVESREVCPELEADMEMRGFENRFAWSDCCRDRSDAPEHVDRVMEEVVKPAALIMGKSDRTAFQSAGGIDRHPHMKVRRPGPRPRFGSGPVSARWLRDGRRPRAAGARGRIDLPIHSYREPVIPKRILASRSKGLNIRTIRTAGGVRLETGSSRKAIQPRRPSLRDRGLLVEAALSNKRHMRLPRLRWLSCSVCARFHER